ncbi:FtsH protease activity modulator HflK [Nevskia soli]|uniref:FtsH protease activity modulator HflK n=1 Tax=Nevskia soli TaxID=418856 RepID=UPI0004A72343|nr:FtsH protease activity modulator HflK [Nevskia soli]
MAWNEPGNNNRDPWNQGSGGKRGELPPDLSQLLKRFKERWGGGKGLGGVPVLLFAALLGLIWLLFGFYKVEEQERALVIRFGAYARTENPGLHWHLPPPFEHVKMVNVGVPRQAPVQSELFTKDQNLVDIGLTVQFRVSSVEENAFNVDSPDDTLRYAAKNALQQVVAGYTIDEVVGKSDLRNSQAEIVAKTRQLLQQTLDGYHCGLQITELTLSKVSPPDALVPAFADTIKAADDQKRARNDAQAYASSRVPVARGEAARSVTEAQAYRDQVIARAEGDVARFNAVLQEYRKSPQVTRKRLYLDTMTEIYSKSGTVLMDVDKGNPGITVPLQQMLNAAPETPAPAVAPPSAAAPPASGNDDSGARSRNREGR